MTCAGGSEEDRRTRLVSVLLPCYDRPYALQTRAIPSLLAQTHSNWELIVVSEGENNSAMRDAVAGFNDPRIRYEEVSRPDCTALPLRCRQHAIGARAMNHAQDLATGEVICLLNEEDKYLPNHIRESLEALDADSADLVYGSVSLRDLNTGQQSHHYFPWADPSNQMRFCDENIIHASSVCYTAKWRTVAFPADGDKPADYGKWSGMLNEGARFVSLAAPQVVSYGDDITGKVRVSMPSLASTESLHNLVDRIAASRQLSNNGPINAELEDALGNYIGTRHVVTAASGDTALGIAMLFTAEQRGNKDEVILPSYTFPSTVNAVVRAGLTPVFCDVEPESLCASAVTMAPLVSERTIALLPVHAHGVPCEMGSMESLAHDVGALLITDAAAGLGARIGTRTVGAFGDMEVFSLSSTKILTSGEGGFICLNDDYTEARLREIARYGLDANYVSAAPGVNGRLAELSAGIALMGMGHLDDWLAARRQTATLYEQSLGMLQHLRIVPHRVGDRIGTAKDVVIVVESSELRDHLAERLARYGIETRPYYRPLHLMAPFKQHVRLELEVTDQLADKTLCLPITNEIPEATTEYVIGVFKHELSLARCD